MEFYCEHCQTWVDPVIEIAWEPEEGKTYSKECPLCGGSVINEDEFEEINFEEMEEFVSFGGKLTD
jgi:hypothetical protein